MNGFFTYKYRATPLHKLDPRSNFVILITIMTVSWKIMKLEFLLLSFLIMIIISIISGIRFQESVKMLLPVFLSPFIIAFIFFYIVSGNITQTFFLTIKFITRMTIMFFGGVVFFTTTSPLGFAFSMRKFGISSKASLTFALTLSFIPVTTQLIKQIYWAQKARGGKDMMSFKALFFPHQYIFPILIPLYRTTMRYVDEINLSLHARGFRIEDFDFPRGMKLNLIDYIVIVIGIGIIILVNLFL